MREFLKTFFFSGIIFGAVMSLIYGMFMGIIAGFLFGLTMSVIMQLLKRKFKKEGTEIIDGKNIIMDGGANHFVGMEGVGGWLYLTPDEIIFKSHNFNIQNHKLIIPLNQIQEIKTVPTAKIIPNGLEIKTKEDNIEKFVINNRKTWVEKINETISLMNKGEK